MKTLPVQLMELGGSFATYVSETTVLLIMGIGMAMALWRQGCAAGLVADYPCGASLS